jgi:NADH-quinone oxidoreductase subunit J
MFLKKNNEDYSVAANSIFFTIFSTVAIISSLAMITRKHPLSSALSLVVAFISLAGLYSLLAAKFIFIIQILVYAGAIMTLIIFSIMLLNVQDDDLPKETNIISKAATSLLLMIPVIIVIIKAIMTITDGKFPAVESNYGTINAVGYYLFTNYAFPFEVVSILLLIGLLGVVVLAKRKI